MPCMTKWTAGMPEIIFIGVNFIGTYINMIEYQLVYLYPERSNIYYATTRWVL